MSSTTFWIVVKGSSPAEAFRNAKEETRQFLEGNGEATEGYTGTILEKESYRFITDTAEGLIEQLRNEDNEEAAYYLENVVKSKDALKIARVMAITLCEIEDRRFSDKWGPAGCLLVCENGKDSEYIFFGWASC